MIFTKRQIIIIFGIVLGTIPVVFLYLDYLSTFEKSNGFKRNFKTIIRSEPKAVIDLKYPGYYLAGTAENELFLGHYSAPAHILRVQISNLDTTHFNITFPFHENMDLNWKNLRTRVLGHHIYLGDGTTGRIYFSSIAHRNKLHAVKLPLPFDTYLPLSPNKYVIRAYNPELNQNVLEIVLLSDTTEVHLKKLESQGEGIFSTDGLLKYADSTIVYVYYYQNEISVLNQNLNPQTEFHTIDTITQVKIKLQNNNGSITFEQPPLRVNKKFSLNDGYIYNNSALIADNETIKKFRHQSVIDVYSIKKPGYLYSFYIPAYKNELMNEFQVLGNTLIARYGHYLVIYQFLR